jgi:hypothetical protein
MTETAKTEKREKPQSRRGAFVAGVLVGAFAGALTTLLLLDEDDFDVTPDRDDDRDDDAPARPGRSTARPAPGDPAPGDPGDPGDPTDPVDDELPN